MTMVIQVPPSSVEAKWLEGRRHAEDTALGGAQKGHFQVVSEMVVDIYPQGDMIMMMMMMVVALMMFYGLDGACYVLRCHRTLCRSACWHVSGSWCTTRLEKHQLLELNRA